MIAGEIYRGLWRHKFFITALTAVLVAVSWYFTSRQTPVYEASTLVRVQQRIQDPGQALGALEASEQLARTYANIVQTRELYGRVTALVPSASQDVKISAEPVADLGLLWIKAKSSDPQHAAQVANAAPEALRSLISQTGTLRDQIVTVDRADTPVKPVAPNLKMNIAIALLLGLIFNGALALLIEVLSDRLPEPDELEAALGCPILATIPALSFPRLDAREQQAREQQERRQQDGRADILHPNPRFDQRTQEASRRRGFTVG